MSAFCLQRLRVKVVRIPAMGNCGSSKKKQREQQSSKHKTGKSQKTQDEVGLEPPAVPLSPQVARESSKKKLIDSNDPAKTLLSSPTSNPTDEPPDETSPPTPVSSKAVIPDNLDNKQNETAEGDNTTDKKVSIEGIRPNVMVLNTRKQTRERI
jgi:hypothetical protein